MTLSARLESAISAIASFVHDAPLALAAAMFDATSV